MEVLFLILQIAWAILGVMLFIKVWKMTEDVKEIRNLLHTRSQSQGHNTPRTAPTGAASRLQRPVSSQSSEEAYVSQLRKGAKVQIKGFGTCVFEGVWSDKYAFYPQDTKNLPASPFLVNDVEPYLLIPASDLKSMLER